MWHWASHADATLGARAARGNDFTEGEGGCASGTRKPHTVHARVWGIPTLLTRFFKVPAERGLGGQSREWVSGGAYIAWSLVLAWSRRQYERNFERVGFGKETASLHMLCVRSSFVISLSMLSASFFGGRYINRGGRVDDFGGELSLKGMGKGSHRITRVDGDGIRVSPSDGTALLPSSMLERWGDGAACKGCFTEVTGGCLIS